MSEEISKAYRTWRDRLRRDHLPDIERAFTAGYRAASVPPIIREAFANERAKEEAEHAGLTTSTVAAWRYKDHGDDRWSFSDGPDGVAMADIIEPLFTSGAAPALAAPEADPREWNLDMSAAPHDGTIVEVCARYPDATAGFPRYAGFSPAAECWLEYSRHQPERVIPWAWRTRTDWPDMPREPRP